MILYILGKGGGKAAAKRGSERERGGLRYPSEASSSVRLIEARLGECQVVALPPGAIEMSADSVVGHIYIYICMYIYVYIHIYICI